MKQQSIPSTSSFVCLSFTKRLWSLGAAALFLCAAFNAPRTAAQTISTVAGNGTQGNTGDGGAATSAELTYPENVLADGSGNYYIVSQNVIRKVTSAGVISTYAGGGTSLSDGIAATSAQLRSPFGLALDSSGNLYIGDSGSDRVRKITASTGIITTVAGTSLSGGYSGDGGAATSAKLNAPEGVAVDSSGNVYIADLANSRIRKVNASTGIITTYAGNGTAGYSGDTGAATSAELYHPFGLAIDSSNNLYLSDNVNERVRKVTASTGIISLVAGNGVAGYSGNGMSAISAELYNPLGISLNSSGVLYIADNQNQVIRAVLTSGLISNYAGSTTAGYSGDGGVATNAELDSPEGVSAQASGKLYISDSANQRVRLVQ